MRYRFKDKAPASRLRSSAPDRRGFHQSRFNSIVTLILTSALLATAASSASEADPSTDGFLRSTPQIEDPLRPLSSAAIAAEHLTVHAAVVGVADPLETQLGRAFDIQLASLIRAFHSRDYVLDGFALTWNAGLASELRKGGRLPGDSTAGFEDDQRSRPSVLLFRKDLWRSGHEPGTDSPPTPGVEYVVLFLVGESPTFGLQPEAFLKAAKCAAALNNPSADEATPPGNRLSQGALRIPCTDLFNRKVDTAGVWTLDVVGPSFSGSMESLATSLGSMFETTRHACVQPDLKIDSTCTPRRLEVNVLSPSASVKSNAHVADWAKTLSGNAARIEYRTLAASLEQQLVALCQLQAIDKDDDKGDPRRIVILAEESSFGRGVTELLEKSEALQEIEGCTDRIQVRNFPQNISAIRGEQVRREAQSNAGVEKLLPSRGRLLPLDLTEVGESVDRPPAYHRLLSSRSDELMLYQSFDALRVYAKPVAVAIVATDVRDRLFLLNEVRKNLPTVLPVLMEMDFLTAHPDYRSISRGSVVIPNGETVVKLCRTSESVLTECPKVRRALEKPAPDTGADASSGERPEFQVFPADYAANMFRATLGLVDRFEGRSQDWLDSDAAPATRPLVTTLAGFQRIERDGGLSRNGRPRPPRSVLLAADSRLSLEWPFYLALGFAGLGLTIIALWLFTFGRAHLIMTSPLRNCNPRKGVKEPDQDALAEESGLAESASEGKLRRGPTALAAGTCRLLSALLCAIGLALLVIAATYFWYDADSRSWFLAHGRDAKALAGLVLIYAALTIVGLWRLALWQGRYGHFRSKDGIADPAYEGHDRPTPTRHNAVALPVSIAILLVLLISVMTRGLVNSVDSPWPSLLMSLTLLPIGAWFLAQFWTQARHWSELALALGTAMDTVSKRVTPTNASDEMRWPSPTAIGELPQSPYSLQFRERDLDTFCASTETDQWARDTRRLRSGDWPFGEGRSQRFLKWQARLVAEMRYASVAVRSAAWCGVLAPTAVLIGLNVYPPYDQRLQTTVSVAMIVSGFLLIMFQALRLERDPLLSRMFTQHGDKLSLGGAFGALWPKLIAAAVILIPVLFPEVPASLSNLIRSINSLQ
jgi:hypothetical protein